MAKGGKLRKKSNLHQTIFIGHKKRQTIPKTRQTFPLPQKNAAPPRRGDGFRKNDRRKPAGCKKD
jgi:hypothetical protein